MPRRSGRRHATSSDANALPSLVQMPFQRVQNHMAPHAPLSDDQLAQIDQKSKSLLADYGIEVMCPEARKLYQSVGALVDEETHIVRLDGETIDALISSAPASCEVYSTNQARSLLLGGNHIHFGMVSGAPNVDDAISGRRAGNFADYPEFHQIRAVI